MLSLREQQRQHGTTRGAKAKETSIRAEKAGKETHPSLFAGSGPFISVRDLESDFTGFTRRRSQMTCPLLRDNVIVCYYKIILIVVLWCSQFMVVFIVIGFTKK